MVALAHSESNMLAFLTFLILILSIILHEVAHGYAANALGDPTARLEGRLTLNPVPHIDLMGSVIVPLLLTITHSPIFFGWAKPVPYNPYNLKNQRWGESLVAVAGSATNIALAVVFGLLVRFGGALPAPALELAATISFINLFLGAFNLIPFPPLDGFTALRAALPWRLSHVLARAERRIREGGALSLLLFLLIFSYILAGPFFNLVAFVFSSLTGVSF